MKKQTQIFSSESPEDLTDIARALIIHFGEKKIVAFKGEMGSGKTTLIKAICHSLGVKDQVSSPTFSLVNEYIDSSNNPVYHFDFYRIKDLTEALDIGPEEYFTSGYYCFIEWPERVSALLPDDSVLVMITTDAKSRKITVEV